MKATQQLKDEHQGVEIALSVLEKISQKLEKGESINKNHLEDLLEFLQVFVDKCHHTKEEDVLFTALEKSGLPREMGPIAVMLTEHDEGRSYIKGLSEGIAKYETGNKPAIKKIVENIKQYVSLLRDHIGKEEGILYKIADSTLPGKKQEEMSKEFAKIEEEKIGSGKHEQFHKMLDELKKVYLD